MQKNKKDECSQNGVEDWTINVWAGGSSPFFANNDFLTTWEFEMS